MVRFSQSVPAGTNTLYAVDEIPETALAGLFILASTDCTIKTNSTGSPTNTFSLKAGVPLAWSSISGNTYFGNPLSGNITSIYVTNAAACQLDIFAMIAG